MIGGSRLDDVCWLLSCPREKWEGIEMEVLLGWFGVVMGDGWMEKIVY